MFRTEEATNQVLSLYHRYNNRNKNENNKSSQDDLDTSAMNTLELDGRNLKLFPALSKDDADKMEKDYKASKMKIKETEFCYTTDYLKA